MTTKEEISGPDYKDGDGEDGGVDEIFIEDVFVLPNGNIIAKSDDGSIFFGRWDESKSTYGWKNVTPPFSQFYDDDGNRKP